MFVIMLFHPSTFAILLFHLIMLIHVAIVVIFCTIHYQKLSWKCSTWGSSLFSHTVHCIFRITVCDFCNFESSEKLSLQRKTQLIGNTNQGVNRKSSAMTWYLSAIIIVNRRNLLCLLVCFIFVLFVFRQTKEDKLIS